MTRYRTIVADPPWDYPEGFASGGKRPHRQEREKGIVGGDTMVRPSLPYQAMTLAEIRTLPIAELADRDARLFLWATMKYLPAGLEMLPAWGFAYRQLIVWDKTPNIPPFGGSVAPNAAEFLIVAAKGNPPCVSRWATSVIRARKARTAHSRKPDVFLDLIEQVSSGPYVELFARRARFGWDYWGDESLGTAEMDVA